MGGLLETAMTERDVQVRMSDQFGSVGCALRSEVTNICGPASRETLTRDSGEAGPTEGLTVNAFTVVTSLAERVMCADPTASPALVRDAMEMESEKAAGLALWGGTGENPDLSFQGPDVATVAAGASTNATVAALLKEFWSRATGVQYQDTIIHLGVGALLELFGEIEAGLIKNLNIRTATSPGYPSDMVAVTGPVLIKLGPIEVIPRVDESVNRQLTEAVRLGSIQFDPCMAVVVA